MKSGRAVLSVFDSLLDRILCVMGAVLFSQVPEFMQQYLQRLGGHLAEAIRQLSAFQQTASQAGLSLDQLIEKTGSNADPAVARLGGVMTDAAQRVSSLQTAHDALLHAEPWMRPVSFVRHLDLEIARATLGIFKPAVPTTIEGLTYALCGMVVFLTFYHVALRKLWSLFQPAGHRARPQS